ncbi:MAG: hypothetical protein JWO11_542, partial [Nocardioides sp.]|nr:hypothetical protein [Nocardioides sp.]
MRPSIQLSARRCDRTWSALLGVAGILAVLLTPMLVSPGAVHAAAAKPHLKPRLTGLLNRTGPPPPRLRHSVRSYVLPVSWKDLQPT